MDTGPSSKFQLWRVWMKVLDGHQNLDNHATAQSRPCRESSVDLLAQLAHEELSNTSSEEHLEPSTYHLAKRSLDDRQGRRDRNEPNSLSSEEHLEPSTYHLAKRSLDDRQGRCDRNEPNSLISPICWGYCCDEKPLLDENNKAPDTRKSLPYPRRKEELSLMAVCFLQKLFGFGVESVELPQHENPLQKQVLHLPNDESGIFDWLIITEALLERIYQRLRFLYYRLAVYTIACFWSYSVFPGRIRPLCTTMPWTIWPALVVLWGVCWMFYPSLGETSLDNQPHLEYQLQPEGLDEVFLGLDRYGVDPILLSLGDSSFSAEWSNPGQPSTTYDFQTVPMNHDVEAWPPTSTSMSQPGLATIFDPDRSTTTAPSTGLASQHDLLPGLQQNSQTQLGGPEMEGITNNIVAATSASEPHAANPLKCPKCPKVLSRRDALERHQRSQHERGMEEHLCPHNPCKHSTQGSGFRRRDGLRRHLKACKSRPRSAATVALEPMNSQPDSGNETREETQVNSPRQDTCSTQGPNGVSSQQSPANSWVEELRKRYEEAKVVYERKKREFEEAQRVMDSYETLIENAEREHAA